MPEKKCKNGHGIWCRKIRKERTNKRHHGESYISASGKIVKERTQKPLQNCRANCKEQLPDNIRAAFFKEYWTLGTHDRRVQYLSALIEKKKTAVARKRLPES